MYLNSVTIVGFVGAEPEQRQARASGAKFTVLSVATQRSWKSAQDEWVSKTEWHRVAIFPGRGLRNTCCSRSGKARTSWWKAA
jgi:single-strand DNA-binding protein